MIKDLLKLWSDYRFHQRANKALQQLRLHTDRELQDIGIGRGELYSAAHHKCPFCQRFEKQPGGGKGL